MNDSNNTNLVPFEKRLTVVESEVGHLLRWSEGFETSVAKKFAEVSEGQKISQRVLSEKLDQLSDRGKLTWPYIFGVATFLFALIGGGWVVHEQSISPIREFTLRNERRLHVHEHTKAHPPAMELLGRYEERFKTLNTALESAISHRKDIDDKHVASVAHLQVQIEELKNSLDDGVGRRVEDKLLGVKENIKDLQRQIGNSK